MASAAGNTMIAEQGQDVRQRGRVGVGMGAVGVEEAASVGSQLLDEFERCDRALREVLYSAFQRMGFDVGRKVHRYALPHQGNGTEQRQRQQHPQQRAHQIDPEVAQRRGLLACEAANEGDACGKTGRTRQEVLCGKANHLRQVAQRGLAAVRLPCRGGGKTQRGVAGQVHRHRRGQEARVRTAREQRLQHQDREQQRRAEQAEGHEAQDVGGCAHLPGRVDAQDAIQDALYRA